MLQNRFLHMQLVTVLVWAIDSQEHGAGMHYSWASSLSWHPYSAPTNLLLCWHRGLRTSAKHNHILPSGLRGLYRTEVKLVKHHFAICVYTCAGLPTHNQLSAEHTYIHHNLQYTIVKYIQYKWQNSTG